MVNGRDDGKRDDTNTIERLKNPQRKRAQVLGAGGKKKKKKRWKSQGKKRKGQERSEGSGGGVSCANPHRGGSYCLASQRKDRKGQGREVMREDNKRRIFENITTKSEKGDGCRERMSKFQKTHEPIGVFLCGGGGARRRLKSQSGTRAAIWERTELKVAFGARRVILFYCKEKKSGLEEVTKVTTFAGG